MKMSSLPLRSARRAAALALALPLAVRAAPPPAADSLYLSAKQSLSTLTNAVGLGNQFNPVVRGNGNFLTALQGGNNAVGRFEAGSTNIAAGTANPVNNTNDARMIQPFRGANSTTYILGGTTETNAGFGLVRYDYSNFSNVRTAANPFGAFGMEGWDWVDDDTIVTTLRGGGNKRIGLIDISAQPFAAAVNPQWNTNGFVTAPVTTRVRNVQVGETYTNHAYYGDNGNNISPAFYALNLATGASTLLGNLGPLTGGGSFGLWTVKEAGGYLYVSTTDNGVFVYSMNSATNIGPLHTTYSKAALDALTGYTGQYWGFDIAPDSSRFLLGGPENYEISPRPAISIGRLGNNLEVAWSGGTLHTSTNLADWLPEPGAVSPLLFPPSEPKKFFRAVK